MKGRYDRIRGKGASSSRTALVYLWMVIAILIVIGVTAYFYQP